MALRLVTVSKASRMHDALTLLCTSATPRKQVFCSEFPAELESAESVILTVNDRDLAPILPITSDDFLVKKVNPDTYPQLITPGSTTGLVSYSRISLIHYCCNYCVCVSTAATSY
jgi:hypothetical protein